MIEMQKLVQSLILILELEWLKWSVDNFSCCLFLMVFLKFNYIIKRNRQKNVLILPDLLCSFT